MRSGSFSSGLFIYIAASTLLQAATAVPETIRPVLNQYCTGCHNQKLKTGGLALDNLQFDNVAADGEIWEKVIRKLRTGADHIRAGGVRGVRRGQHMHIVGVAVGLPQFAGARGRGPASARPAG